MHVSAEVAVTCEKIQWNQAVADTKPTVWLYFPFGRLKWRCSKFSCSLLWTEWFGMSKFFSLVVTVLRNIICWRISIRKASGVNNTRSKWIIRLLLRWSLRKNTPKTTFGWRDLFLSPFQVTKLGVAPWITCVTSERKIE